VGIIPLQEPSRITTKGLEWDVTDWETRMGGRISTSNHVLPETKIVEVQTTKDVLFTIALSCIDGEEDG
jgi:thiamine pyrophosphokinase